MISKNRYPDVDNYFIYIICYIYFTNTEKKLKGFFIRTV